MADAATQPTVEATPPKPKIYVPDWTKTQENMKFILQFPGRVRLALFGKYGSAKTSMLNTFASSLRGVRTNAGIVGGEHEHVTDKLTLHKLFEGSNDGSPKEAKLAEIAKSHKVTIIDTPGYDQEYLMDGEKERHERSNFLHCLKYIQRGNIKVNTKKEDFGDTKQFRRNPKPHHRVQGFIFVMEANDTTATQKGSPMYVCRDLVGIAREEGADAGVMMTKVDMINPIYKEPGKLCDAYTDLEVLKARRNIAEFLDVPLRMVFPMVTYWGVEHDHDEAIDAVTVLALRRFLEAGADCHARQSMLHWAEDVEDGDPMVKKIVSLGFEGDEEWVTETLEECDWDFKRTMVKLYESLDEYTIDASDSNERQKAIDEIVSIHGFHKDKAAKALLAANNNLNKAMAWLYKF